MPTTLPASQERIGMKYPALDSLTSTSNDSQKLTSASHFHRERRWSALILRHQACNLSKDGVVALRNDNASTPTLNSVATKLLSTPLNHSGDIGIGGSLGNLALSGLERVPSSEDDVGLSASDLASSNDNSSSSVGGVSVNVSSANAVYKTRYVRFITQ